MSLPKNLSPLFKGIGIMEVWNVEVTGNKKMTKFQ